MSAPMTPEPIAEIRAEVERLAAKAVKPNPWPVDNEAHAMADGWARGTENALERTARPLLAEVERLRAELDARCDKDGCEQYREWLSGEKAEADKRARQAEAERDAVRAELATVLNNYAGLQAEAITLEGERDEARIEAGQLRAALAEERARHGELVAEMQRARQTADDARAEQVRLAEQVRVLSGLLRRGNPKVFCSKHPNHAEPGCEVCRDAGIFRSTLGEQGGDQTDG